MFKKTITALILFVFVLNSAGCSGVWRRKFIRKKKDVKEEPILQPKDYKKEFTGRQFYANHYAFWKNSEAELIKAAKGKKGQKRIKTYGSYAGVELKKLYELLIDEKQKEFKPLVDEFGELFTKVTQPDYLDANRNMLVRALNKHHRNVARKFSFFKMKKHIRPDDELITAGVGNNETQAPKEEEPDEPEYVEGLEKEVALDVIETKEEVQDEEEEETAEELVKEEPESPDDIQMGEEAKELEDSQSFEEAGKVVKDKEKEIGVVEDASKDSPDDKKSLEGVTEFNIDELNNILEKYDIEPYKPGEKKS
ncbi:MAG: hypothetical protein ABH843_06325 [Candidatus Omnitrophota bacterium]